MSKLSLASTSVDTRPEIIFNISFPKNTETWSTVSLINSISENPWRKGSLEALKLLKDKGYKVIIISNQPGISRGMMSEKDLAKIHSNMIKDVKKIGAQIESIYICKCNWNDGCDCRKPKPGMIFNAQYDHDINLSRTYFIGDDQRDMEAAKSAGCKQFLIGENDRLDDVIKTLLDN